MSRVDGLQRGARVLRPGSRYARRRKQLKSSGGARDQLEIDSNGRR